MQADLKTQVSSFRKPQPYSTEKDIKLYMDDFNSYREVVGLPKRVTYQTFVSYLPDKFKRRLRALQLSNADMEDWDALQPLLIQTLSPPIAKVRAKIELDGARQGTEESILDFVERLQTLVDQCYDKPNELAAKEFLLKDLFMRGLRDERVSISVLTECDSLDLQGLVKLAQKHELAVEAFTLSKKPTKGEEMVSVLPVAENQALPLPQNGKMYDKRCHGCGSTDHFVKGCPLKMQNPFSMGTPIRSRNIKWTYRSRLSCWHCGGPHMKRDCFQLKRNNERPGRATNGYRPQLLNREAR